MVINAVAAAVNVGLNFILIPKFGAMGAAYVTAISFGICPLLAAAISHYYYPVRYELGRLLKVVLTLVGLYALTLFLPSGQPLALALTEKLLILLAAPGVLFILGFYRDDEIAFFRSHIEQKWGRFVRS